MVKNIRYNLVGKDRDQAKFVQKWANFVFIISLW